MKDFKGGNLKYYGRLLLKWIPTSIVLGIIGGILGSLFVLGVEKSNEIWHNNSWLVYFLPIAGLVIALIYQVCGFKEPKGTNRILEKVRADEEVSIKVAPTIFISTIITHLFGGSAGREGAAVQIGGSIGSGFSKLLKLDDKDTSLMVISGVTAVFAALFGTPITAIFFALEVISVGIIYYSGLVPCFLSAITAFMIGKNVFQIKYLDLSFVEIPKLNIEILLKVSVIGLLSAFLSVAFITLLSKTNKLSKKYIPNTYIRILTGAFLVIILTLIFSEGRYNGSGEMILIDTFSGNGRPEDFILKMLFTAVTLGFGFKGGEIVPTFIIGAGMGGFVGSIVGLDPAMGAAIGLVATFCGAVNCPMASIILSVELFGGEGLIYFTGACAISYAFSGYYSLYSSQKIVYSKIKAKFLNVSAKH